ncbi:alkaline shock response membrane anchor protein AmaP [Actinomycetospora straminea]|uniref:Alkaline shock response membrane anchor protein AmaP n=1 Tax=Actinomycetospora straminea TaxID=663607 RepID=A0ABP9ETU0_9PSEU|nr:alkaline shock response membrane anchor protein AmaP [Actinomycetospora straminea]MDD7933245.1 alkaline shock response membrane anchor protein AmaP [Actinomycetospora straminea]
MSSSRATNPPARLNRGLLALAGIVLLAAGGVVAGIATGRLPLVAPGAPLLTAPAAPPAWWTWVAAAAGVVVGLLGLRWLLAQARRRPAGETWSLEAAGATPGRTTIPGGVTADAVRADLTAHPGVVDARVRLTSGAPQPALYVELDLDAEAAPGPAVAHLEQHALPRLRRALDAPRVPTRLLVRTGRARPTDRVA